MNNRKIYYSVLIALLLILVVSTTYAFFAPQQGGTTSTNTTVTSNTTDLLTFSINRDISFTVTQADFEENGENQSGDATATATLTPNNKTGAATMNYYLYLNLQSNPTVYSVANTNHDPELMLQVFDGNNQLVTLTGLGNQQTVKGVTGYDITGVEGLQTLLDNHAISASNNTATIENWRIVITLINHDFNQNDNTGKEVEAELIMQQEPMNLGLTGTIYRMNSSKAVTSYPIYDSQIDVWCDNQNCVFPNINKPGNSYTQYTLTFGTGEYKDSPADFLEEVSVYCISDGNNNSCANANRFFLSSNECSGYLSQGEVCITDTIVAGTYLKHAVNNNIITSTNTCLNIYNNEFCFGPSYWVGYQGTVNKMRQDMSYAFGVTPNECNYYSGEMNVAYCNYGIFQCSLEPNDYWFQCMIRDGTYNYTCHIRDSISYCNRILM